MTKIRAAVYARMSWDEPAPRSTHQEQVRALREFCLKRGYELSNRHVYMDIAFPGTLPIEKRPALEKLFNAAKHKRFDTVVVYRLDRLFRSSTMLMSGVEELSKHGVNLQSITERVDTSNQDTRTLMALLGTFATLERNIINKYDQ